MSVTDINGKVVAITGASSGIGEATARLLAAHGARVALGARREERLRALAGELDGAWAVTDVARRTDVARLAETARERFGRLDALVSNAGVMPIGPFDDLDVEAWEQMVDVNVKGVLFGIAAALPVFRAQGIERLARRPCLQLAHQRRRSVGRFHAARTGGRQSAGRRRARGPRHAR